MHMLLLTIGMISIGLVALALLICTLSCSEDPEGQRKKAEKRKRDWGPSVFTGRGAKIVSV
jgi:hypothetical protein